jgi:hypothetical protein
LPFAFSTKNFCCLTQLYDFIRKKSVCADFSKAARESIPPRNKSCNFSLVLLVFCLNSLEGAFFGGSFFFFFSFDQSPFVYKNLLYKYITIQIYYYTEIFKSGMGAVLDCSHAFANL